MFRVSRQAVVESINQQREEDDVQIRFYDDVQVFYHDLLSQPGQHAPYAPYIPTEPPFPVMGVEEKKPPKPKPRPQGKCAECGQDKGNTTDYLCRECREANDLADNI